MSSKTEKIIIHEVYYCNPEINLQKKIVAKKRALIWLLRTKFKLSYLTMFFVTAFGIVDLQGWVQKDPNLSGRNDSYMASIEPMNEEPLNKNLLSLGYCDGSAPYNAKTHDIAESFSKKSFSYIYGKVGTEAGLGYRRHQNAHGFDISADLIPLVLDNWLSVKGLYLNYPFYNQKRYFYVGAGAGAVYEFGACGHRFYPAFEGVIGYEFRSEKSIKTFLQLEAGVPFSHLSRYAELPIIPAFTFGVGF